MKYKAGDRVKVKNEFDIYEEYRGKQFVIEECDSSDNTYLCHPTTGGYRIWFSEERLEPVVPTLAEIKEKKLTCVIHAKTKREADMLFKAVDSYDHNGKTWASWWDVYKEKTCYRTNLGEVVAYGRMDNYIRDGEKVIEFSDLFPVGSTMMCGDRMYQRTESGITNYELVPEYKECGVASIHDLPTSECYKHFTVVKDEIDALEHMANNVCNRVDITDFDAQRLTKRLADISARFKEEKKMPTKFTFYVKEGTRVDKSCNGTIPTMTTNIELSDGNVFDEITTIKGSATCDKADYDERQGVLEALANAVCGGEFEKRYKKAVKANKDADLWMRTCYYCRKVFDTVEERQEHEAWHVERKKARRERYLLRKRAKEIAFEEQAQKMAKEMIKEDK